MSPIKFAHFQSISPILTALSQFVSITSYIFKRSIKYYGSVLILEILSKHFHQELNFQTLYIENHGVYIDFCLILRLTISS